MCPITRNANMATNTTVFYNTFNYSIWAKSSIGHMTPPGSTLVDTLKYRAVNESHETYIGRIV